MKDVPLVYVKANQIGIVGSVLALLLFREPVIAGALLAVQVTGLASGGGWNLFVLAVKPFLRSTGSGRQAAVLTRFNNALAVIFLTLSSLFFLIGANAAGYITASLLLAAASAALLGYCIGCTIYFRYKQWKAIRRTHS
ncbi:DUF4395 family protein [Gorillibacterium sp. sgz5001074]|uniref:DUF4395 family protein n=1 Tax=Gorillibacterium sp. sgz5001074 TaxID=3446695 RepID=UPI003F680F01